jgi:membrane-associated phospholipid phosphatase
MPSAPLLARRREIVAVIVAAAIGTIVLAVHYAGGHRAGRLDHAIDSRLQHRLGGHLRFLEHLVRLGDPPTVVAICAVLAVVLFFAGRRKAAALAVFGPAVAAGFTEFVLKPLIDRRLNDALSFPSGHTTGAVSVAVVIIVVLIGPSRPRWPMVVRWAASALTLLEAGAVATALVGTGYHYATDTLGGFCVAVGLVLTVALAIDTLAEHRGHARAA